MDNRWIGDWFKRGENRSGDWEKRQKPKTMPGCIESPPKITRKGWKRTEKRNKRHIKSLNPLSVTRQYYWMKGRSEFPAEFIKQRPILDGKYRLLWTLGQGRYCKYQEINIARVKMATIIPTSKKVAIKLFKAQAPFESTQLSNFLNEVNTLTILDCPSIIKITDFKVNGLLTKRNGRRRYVLYYVMQLADNGEIYHLVQTSQSFSQKLSRHYFRQIITAIEHMHNKGIAHRDIKTQNILFDKNYSIKIIDFGFSCPFKDEDGERVPIKTKSIGTVKSNAPQLMNGSNQNVYGDSLDLFSAGCVLFEMTIGSVPFKSSHLEDEYYNKLTQQNKNGFWKIFQNISQPSVEFKNLIERLLDPDSANRLTISQLLKHPWVNGQLPTLGEVTKEMSSRFKRINNSLKSERDAFIRSKIAKGKILVEQEESVLVETEIAKEMQEKIMKLSNLFSEKLEESEGSNSSKEDKEG